jgi:hypothetical protein
VCYSLCDFQSSEAIFFLLLLLSIGRAHCIVDYVSGSFSLSSSGSLFHSCLKAAPSSSVGERCVDVGTMRVASLYAKMKMYCWEGDSSIVGIH